MLKAWLINGSVMFILGFVAGWILIKRPQWVSDLYQWIKHKVRPS